MTGELKGFHVLIVLLAFFGITIGVNVALTAYAISSFSGEDVSKPYQQGLEYNKALAARAAQSNLGWTALIDVQRVGKRGGAIVVTIKGKDHGARAGLTVEVMLRRPTDASLDRTVALQANGEGKYSGTVDGLAAGQWDVIARTSAEDGTPFEARRRIAVR